MQLQEMIYKRKSIRKYTSGSVDNKIIVELNNFFEQCKPLYNDIEFKIELINKENVKCICPWTTKQVIAFFSEEKEGYLENAGFILQQVDLYLQSMGIGTCYLGMGKLDSIAKISYQDNKLKYVMMLAFGYPKEKFRNELIEFKRKDLAKISDIIDERLKPAQYAPSSVNSQPWYFIHENDLIHLFCLKRGLLKKTLIEMNQIDCGIALTHLYICNKDSFVFSKLKNIKEFKNSKYIGSFKI